MKKPNMTLEKTSMPMQPSHERASSFSEAALGYTMEQAISEAERCLGCPAKYCQRSCPIHVPIPDFIAEVRQGNLQAAYDIIRGRNFMPCISGRVCPQENQCEKNCTRAIKGQAVAIGRLERFVADYAKDSGAVTAAASKSAKAAVIGSGPAGLSCARVLAAAGYPVTIFEARSEPGGIAAYGIPEFVLPPELLKTQLDELIAMGVRIRTGTVLGKDFTLRQLMDDGYQALFVGTGAEKPVETDCGGAEFVIQAADYLSAARNGNAPEVKGTVVVVGGGNTAVDAARTAVRCGAERTVLMYRRTEEEIPARLEEIQWAREEGVEIMTLSSPVAFEESTVKFAKMELTAPDYPGGRKNVAPVAGSEETLEAELVILALGFENKPVDSLETDAKNRILVDDRGQTSFEGVFAGGDAVSGPSTLIKAAAAGARAAEAMIAFLEKTDKTQDIG